MVMKLYLSHASSFDYQKELYEPLKQALAGTYDIFFPHDKANIDTNAKDILADCDFVLAEVSYPSTGQGIELGRASAADIPIICFYRTGAHISQSLRFVSNEFIEYATPEEMTVKLSELLSRQSRI